MKTFFTVQISDKSAAPIRTMSFPLSSRLVICQIFSLLQMEWGGHKAGDYASRYTVETLEKLIRESTLSEPAAIIESAVKQANTMLLGGSE